MTDVPPPSPEPLRCARASVRHEGLSHVYMGNVHDREEGTTSCAACSAAVIERDWYQIVASNLASDGVRRMRRRDSRPVRRRDR